MQVAALMKKPVPYLIHSSPADEDPRIIGLMDLGALARVSQKTLLTDVARVFQNENRSEL